MRLSKFKRYLPSSRSSNASTRQSQPLDVTHAPESKFERRLRKATRRPPKKSSLSRTAKAILLNFTFPRLRRSKPAFIPKYDGHGHNAVVDIFYSYLRIGFHCPDQTDLSKELKLPPLAQFIADVIDQAGLAEDGQGYWMVANALVILHHFRVVRAFQFDYNHPYSGHLFFASALVVAQEHPNLVVGSDAPMPPNGSTNPCAINSRVSSTSSQPRSQPQTLDEWCVLTRIDAQDLGPERDAVYRIVLDRPILGKDKVASLWEEPILQAVGWPVPKGCGVKEMLARGRMASKAPKSPPAPGRGSAHGVTRRV